MTYVHSEIENGNAGPSPLFSRSLQFSERERKQKSDMIILLFLSLLSLLFTIFVSLAWLYLILDEQMFTTTIVILYMRKTSEMEVKYIELANKFIWVFL